MSLLQILGNLLQNFGDFVWAGKSSKSGGILLGQGKVVEFWEKFINFGEFELSKRSLLL